MALAVTVRASLGQILGVEKATAVTVRATFGGALAVYQFPTPLLKAAQGLIQAATRGTAVQLRVSQAHIIAVVKGRTANPNVRAWTYTLDGHDFYVLRLGDDETLVYDTASEQFVQWDSDASGAWRPNTGITWIGGQALAPDYGSNVVAGDDTFGLLWLLDPDLAYDENPDYTRTPVQIPFVRILSGQALVDGREFSPCYAIFVDGDNYGLTVSDFVPAVTLETSDDQGRTFYSHDTLNIATNYDDDNPYSWYSLGQINSPGRIFRLTDNGLFARVDTIQMNDGQDDGS